LHVHRYRQYSLHGFITKMLFLIMTILKSIVVIVLEFAQDHNYIGNQICHCVPNTHTDKTNLGDIFPHIYVHTCTNANTGKCDFYHLSFCSNKKLIINGYEKNEHLQLACFLDKYNVLELKAHCCSHTMSSSPYLQD